MDGVRDLFTDWEISDDISLTVQVAIKSNRKSYVAYRMTPLPASLINLEWPWMTWKVTVAV